MNLAESTGPHDGPMELESSEPLLSPDIAMAMDLDRDAGVVTRSTHGPPDEPQWMGLGLDEALAVALPPEGPPGSSERNSTKPAHIRAPGSTDLAKQLAAVCTELHSTRADLDAAQIKLAELGSVRSVLALVTAKLHKLDSVCTALAAAQEEFFAREAERAAAAKAGEEELLKLLEAAEAGRAEAVAQSVRLIGKLQAVSRDRQISTIDEADSGLLDTSSCGGQCTHKDEVKLERMPKAGCPVESQKAASLSTERAQDKAPARSWIPVRSSATAKMAPPGGTVSQKVCSSAKPTAPRP
ncbi:hypothetical protein HDU96_003408 [Phlyctochytrium bullatum]|nr:hypothetical protein HDU96_003408 [Phlyctochytrium bullatum]